MEVAHAENEKVILKIEYDEGYESPREWDNLGTMVCWHRNYNLGDEHNYDSPREFLEGLAEEFTNLDMEKLWDKTDKQLMEIIQKYAIILPLYTFEHGAITMNTTGYSCRWDSGQVGWIYVERRRIREEYSVKRIGKQLKARIEDYLRNEVKTYAQYLEGDVYGFIIEDKETGNQIDSCWGFYGTDYLENGMAEYVGDEYLELLKTV